MSATNSRHSRVQPIFGWLEKHGGNEWPTKLIGLAEGITTLFDCGPLVRAAFEPEHKQSASPARLSWMLLNKDRLVPHDGKRWRELQDRTSDPIRVDKALKQLAANETNLGAGLKLEGRTHADCLIECDNAFIWVEGKRFDWLSSSTEWDSSRDQLARNLDAVWMLAEAATKDYCVLICHEHPLKHHEQELVKGYRLGTWAAGLPHVSAEQRAAFSGRIGLVTWQQIANTWPAMRLLPELQDLAQ